MKAKARTISEIRADGFEALLERLGPADALRFMQQFDAGRGDYTKERRHWLDNVSLDDLMSGITKRESNGGGQNP